MQSYKTQRHRGHGVFVRALSVISVPLCFKSFLAEKMEGLTRELATQFHESEKLQSAIRDNGLREVYEDAMGTTARRLMEV